MRGRTEQSPVSVLVRQDALQCRLLDGFSRFPLALVLVSSNVEIVLTTGSTAERHEPVLHLLRRRGPPVWVKLLCVGVYIRVTMQTPCLRRDNRPA